MRLRRRPGRFGRSPLVNPALPIGVLIPDMPEWPSREDCPTCNAGRDELGRLPIGQCGPDCLGRRVRSGGAQ